jgi:hypothetical protein
MKYVCEIEINCCNGSVVPPGGPVIWSAPVVSADPHVQHVRVVVADANLPRQEVLFLVEMMVVDTVKRLLQNYTVKPQKRAAKPVVTVAPLPVIEPDPVPVPLAAKVAAE